MHIEGERRERNGKAEKFPFAEFIPYGEFRKNAYGVRAAKHKVLNRFR